MAILEKGSGLRDSANRESYAEHRWVAELDGKPVGLALVEYASVHGHSFLKDTMFLEVFVPKKFRGKGIGEKLIKTAMQETFPKPKYWAGFTHHSEGFKALAKKFGIRDNDDISRYPEDSKFWRKDGSFDEGKYDKEQGW